LPTSQGIASVKVYNRDAPHGWALNGFRVDVVRNVEDERNRIRQNCAKNVQIAMGGNKMVACGKSGRYVEITLERTQGLCFCEVKVTLMYTFLGLSKSRTQERGGSNADAAKAVDGSAATNYPSGSCTHTQYAWHPWWQVDMQGLADIVKIKVTNRGDCCGNRLNGYNVEIDGVNCAENQQIMQNQAVESECRMDGHIVKIIVPRNDWLTLCEVQVATKTATLRPPMVAAVFVIGAWVSIKSLGGKYCTDWGTNVACSSNALRDGDRFLVASGQGGTTKIALKGGFNNRWCADERNRVRCDRNGIGQYERFEPARGHHDTFGGNGVALKAFGIGGGYCADHRTPACDTWQAISAGTCAFRCTSNNSPGPWQTFEVENVGCAGISTAQC